MGRRLISIGALKSLKNNSRVEAVEETSFVDLHLQVAQEVDALIENLGQEALQPQEWELAPEEEVALAPEKILSDVENSN